MKHIAVAALALSVLGGSVAMADSRDDRRNHSSEHRYSHDRRHDNRNDHDRKDHDRKDHDRNDYGRRDRDRRDHDRRDYDRRDWRDDHRRYDGDHRYDYRDRRFDDRYRGRYRLGEYYRPSGYYHHNWRRGERLPRAYYSRPYVLYDYHRYGFRAPPRGHCWVRVDRDAVLAVIATGLVLDVLHDYFY
jgi:Ni/Co efflux regulator RcnB